jgi:hypothetical protein
VAVVAALAGVFAFAANADCFPCGLGKLAAAVAATVVSLLVMLLAMHLLSNRANCPFLAAKAASSAALLCQFIFIYNSK